MDACISPIVTSQVAFSGMEPFPRRSVIVNRHSFHYEKFQKEWLLRERELREREARSKLDKLKKQVSHAMIVAQS